MSLITDKVFYNALRSNATLMAQVTLVIIALTHQILTREIAMTTEWAMIATTVTIITLNRKTATMME